MCSWITWRQLSCSALQKRNVAMPHQRWLRGTALASHGGSTGFESAHRRAPTGFFNGYRCPWSSADLSKDNSRLESCLYPCEGLLTFVNLVGPRPSTTPHCRRVEESGGMSYHRRLPSRVSSVAVEVAMCIRAPWWCRAPIREIGTSLALGPCYH